jgi:formate hydrogenlyase subunit 6/NADH:ubiquinone oxidoreductase subunit I
MFPFLKIMVRNLIQGPATDPYPFAPAQTPAKFRGCVEHDPEKCILCGICRHVCAPGAIQLRPSEDDSGMQFALWHNSCVFCGMCAHYCPTGALTMSTNWKLVHLGEERFDNAIANFIPFGHCTECGKKIQPRPRAITEKLGADNPERFLLCPECKRTSVARLATEEHLSHAQETI